MSDAKRDQNIFSGITPSFTNTTEWPIGSWVAFGLVLSAKKFINKNYRCGGRKNSLSQRVGQKTALDRQGTHFLKRYLQHRLRKWVPGRWRRRRFKNGKPKPFDRTCVHVCRCCDDDEAMAVDSSVNVSERSSASGDLQEQTKSWIFTYSNDFRNALRNSTPRPNEVIYLTRGASL